MGRQVDVLVVEERSVDAEVTLSALRKGSTRDAKLLRLRDGNEALRYLFAVGEFANRSPEMPGLVLLDMGLPVASGLCVLDVMRAHPATKDIPVVMLTTDNRPHFAEDFGFSPDGYLVKSQDFDQYCAAIELTLSDSNGMPTHVRWVECVVSGHSGTGTYTMVAAGSQRTAR